MYYTDFLLKYLLLIMLKYWFFMYIVTYLRHDINNGNVRLKYT